MKLTSQYLDKHNIEHNVSADGLITITQDFRPSAEITCFDKVERITGSVYVRQGATFTAPALAKSGSVYVRQGATFTAPALAKSGSVDVQQGATFTAPALAKSGSVYVRQGATFTAPALAEVSGYVDVQQGATFTALKLKNVEEVRFNGTFLGEEITVVDGIGCVVVSEKQKDGVKIRQCRKSTFKDGKLAGDKFYVASRGNNNAHAESIQIALQELAFKEGSRNIEQFRNIAPETKKSAAEWAFIYRMITGACQYGTRSFMESKGKLKAKYTLAEIITETNGAFGHEKFKGVVIGKAA